MTRNTLFYSFKYLNSTSKAMYFLLCTETNKTLFEILTKQFVFVPLLFVTITIILGSFLPELSLFVCVALFGEHHSRTYIDRHRLTEFKIRSIRPPV